MTSLALPVDYDALRRAMVAAVSQGTGLPAGQIMMMQPEAPNAPRPQVPYVGIRTLSASIAMGQDAAVSLGDAANPGSYGLCGPRNMLVSFEAFGATHEQAFGVMVGLQAALQSQPVRDGMLSANLALSDVGPVRDASSLLLTCFEGRAMMDCTFTIVSELTIDLGQMAEANVAGEVTLDDLSQVQVSLPAITA